MTETSVPVSDNLGRLLRARAEKIATGRFIQPVIRGANIYLIGFAILGCISILSTFYVDAVSHAPLLPAAISFLTTLFTLIVGGIIATTMALWLACDKGVAGRHGVHSTVDYDGNRAIYVHDNSTPEKKHIEIFEIVCWGQLVDKFFKGNGPVDVLPVIEQDQVNKLNEDYEKTKKRPELPAGVHFHGAWRLGTTYIQPADFKPTLLGNEYSILPDDMRKFIWEKWPHLTAGAIVNVAWKRIAPEKEVDTSYREAGIDYEIASLKAQNHSLKKVNEDLLGLLEDQSSARGGEPQ